MARPKSQPGSKANVGRPSPKGDNLLRMLAKRTALAERVAAALRSAIAVVAERDQLVAERDELKARLAALEGRSDPPKSA